MEFITNGRWEKLDGYTSRMKVPYGWVLRTFEDRGSDAGGCVSQIFIKDMDHIWKIERD